MVDTDLVTALVMIFVVVIGMVIVALATMDFLAKRREDETERAKQRARQQEREDFSQRLRERAELVNAHVQDVIDYDFARDNVAGRETTEYKEGDDSDQVSGVGT